VPSAVCVWTERAGLIERLLDQLWAAVSNPCLRTSAPARDRILDRSALAPSKKTAIVWPMFGARCESYRRHDPSDQSQGLRHLTAKLHRFFSTGHKPADSGRALARWGESFTNSSFSMTG